MNKKDKESIYSKCCDINHIMQDCFNDRDRKILYKCDALMVVLTILRDLIERLRINIRIIMNPQT